MSTVVSYELACDREFGFLADPNVHKRLGYVVRLEGMGLPDKALAADLRVVTPFGADFVPVCKALAYSPASGTAKTGTAKVVGTIGKLSWSGGVGAPIAIDFYVSPENAQKIATVQGPALKSIPIHALGWWIADYDPEAKQWFEQAYPLESAGAVSGLVADKDNPLLKVDLTLVAAKQGMDVHLCKVSIAVVPPADVVQKLYFANTAQKKEPAKLWGLSVGNLAAGPIDPP